MSKHKSSEPKLPAKAEDSNNTFGKNFAEGTSDAALAAGLITGTVALVKAVTHHELSPSEMFLVSVLGPGVAHAVTKGTMKFISKFSAEKEEAHGKLTLAGSKTVPALIEGEKPKQLPAPEKLDLKAAEHKQLHAGNAAEGTQAMKAAAQKPPTVQAGAQQHAHGRKHHGRGPRHGGHQ